MHYIWVWRDDDSCLSHGRNGIQQRRNSWQDGVLGTNCPIPPRWNWTYQFQLKDQIGSFFYFPSLNFQRAVGGYGGIVLHNRPVIPVPFDKPDGDITLLIGDWYNRNHTVSVLALFPGFEHICKFKCLDFLFRNFLRACLHLEWISIWRIMKSRDIVCFSISERAFVLECFRSVVLFILLVLWLDSTPNFVVFGCQWKFLLLQCSYTNMLMSTHELTEVMLGSSSPSVKFVSVLNELSLYSV